MLLPLVCLLCLLRLSVALFFLLLRIFLFLLLLVLDINAFLEGIAALVKKGALVAIV